MNNVKILVTRFSSIGDVVLTTPVVRCLKKQIPNATIHFITKKPFSSILENNPYIDKLITIKASINEVISELKTEKYDWIIDLHKNVRTLSLKQKLRAPSRSFPKMNLEKWMLVKLKIDKMPKIHVVDRYFETVKHLGIKNDSLPCDFFLAKDSFVNIAETFSISSPYITIALGAQFATKRLPFKKLTEIITEINEPIILIGGTMDNELATEIISHFPLKSIKNACGGFSLQQSASIVKQSKVLLTNDTGMMHIASCFEIPIVSVWGNTVPSLGMYPYFPKSPELFSIHEVKNLNCRPCSKIGYKKCPKSHFNCMNLQNSNEIIEDINVRMSN
jgi:ADP-heptose:LPS heptosyltransferase